MKASKSSIGNSGGEIIDRAERMLKTTYAARSLHT
jgi:hypothetical protein